MENKVICDSLNGFSKGKSSLTKLVTFSDGNKVLLEEEEQLTSSTWK